MKKKLYLLFFFIIIINCVYSSEDSEFDNFLRYINDTLHRVRELCVRDLHIVLDDDYHFLIIEEYKKELLNILIAIDEYNISFYEDIAIKKLINFFKYEVNHILKMNNSEINSNEILWEIDILISAIFFINIIYFYEPSILGEIF